MLACCFVYCNWKNFCFVYKNLIENWFSKVQFNSVCKHNLSWKKDWIMSSSCPILIDIILAPIPPPNPHPHTNNPNIGICNSGHLLCGKLFPQTHILGLFFPVFFSSVCSFHILTTYWKIIDNLFRRFVDFSPLYTFHVQFNWMNFSSDVISFGYVWICRRNKTENPELRVWKNWRAIEKNGRKFRQTY